MVVICTLTTENHCVKTAVIFWRGGEIFLSPHINYIMQPPDGRSWSFKQAFTAESDCGRVTNRKEFFSIFRSCHEMVRATEKMKSFLRSTEIYPLKSDVFTVKEFGFTAMENRPNRQINLKKIWSQIITEDSFSYCRLCLIFQE